MLFNSLSFLVFFSVVLALYYFVRPWAMRKTILLLASYVFYAAWNPPFVILLWISTLIDWFAAGRLQQEEHRGRRLGLLLLSVTANLGILGFYKYGDFLLENFTQLAGLLGIDYQAAERSIVLPVGISFYTFQTMSYTLDVFRKRAQPAPSFLDFALYVTFFPQLVAGPIVRATQFLPQCLTPKWPSRDQVFWGLFLMTLGLFQKVVLADVMLAPAADTIFGWDRGPLAPLDAWLGVLAFSGQIFFDFAGYSTTAIGAAYCFGFSLPDNFRCPYASIGFSDFWRRWHISLSTWLRDYLYIPLGGNRFGAVRTVASLMFTMLLGGLWHGASWTFVVWGGLHGIYLVSERAARHFWGGKVFLRTFTAKLLLALLTWFLINITWVFFRAPDFPSAFLLLISMFGIPGEGAQALPMLEMAKVSIVIPILLTFQWLFRAKRTEEAAETVPSWMHGLAWAGMLVLLLLAQGSDNAFIYFQF